MIDIPEANDFAGETAPTAGPESVQPPTQSPTAASRHEPNFHIPWRTTIYFGMTALALILLLGLLLLHITSTS
jgi:hypothetical protein